MPITGTFECVCAQFIYLEINNYPGFICFQCESSSDPRWCHCSSTLGRLDQVCRSETLA